MYRCADILPGKKIPQKIVFVRKFPFPTKIANEIEIHKSRSQLLNCMGNIS